MLSDVFLVPFREKVLLHAPLHGFSAVINRSGAALIKSTSTNSPKAQPETYRSIINLLKQKMSPPQVRQGELKDPLFLGLLPTRDCNMRCRYCDFPVSKGDPLVVMSRELCQEALDAYFQLLKDHEHQRAAVHFFGGEPFFEPELVRFATEYAQNKAQEMNFSLHLEASSNGLMEEKLAQWIGNTFNCIVLSLDGPESIQNFQRPAKGMPDSYERVISTAKILSDSPCTLILRSCISQESLSQLGEIAEWMAANFDATTICLEPMSVSEQSERNQLHPPDPWSFSKAFLLAEKNLKNRGIQCMLSTADLSLKTVSSCPVGHDALIISPTGEINACYLLKESWLSQGKDMILGKVQGGEFNVAQANLDRVRSYELGSKSLCQNCFCRFHCAGGCHVNHPANGKPGDYDDICIRTRLVSLGKLLMRSHQEDLMMEWLSDRQALERTALWQNDRVDAWS